MPTKPELLKSIRDLAKEAGLHTSVKSFWNKGLLTVELARLQKKKQANSDQAGGISELRSREALYLEHIGAKEDFFTRTYGIPEGTHYQHMLSRVSQDIAQRTEQMFRGLTAFTHMAGGSGEMAKLVRAFRAGDKLPDGSEICLDDLLSLVEKLLDRISTVGGRFQPLLNPDSSSIFAIERALVEYNEAWEALKAERSEGE